MYMLTTKELLRATGLKTVPTLQRWRELDLVPPPTLQKHPNAKRGMTGMWPAWTVHHIAAIKTRLSAGESLADVRATLSGDWNAEAKKWLRKRYDLRAALARMERDHATDEYAEEVGDVFYEFLRDIGIERPGRIGERLWRELLNPGVRDELLQLVRQGFNPVVLLPKDGEVKVVADVLLGSVIHDSTDDCQPIIV